MFSSHILFLNFSPSPRRERNGDPQVRRRRDPYTAHDPPFQILKLFLNPLRSFKTTLLAFASQRKHVLPEPYINSPRLFHFASHRPLLPARSRPAPRPCKITPETSQALPSPSPYSSPLHGMHARSPSAHPPPLHVARPPDHAVGPVNTVLVRASRILRRRYVSRRAAANVRSESLTGGVSWQAL